MARRLMAETDEGCSVVVDHVSSNRAGSVVQVRGIPLLGRLLLVKSIWFWKDRTPPLCVRRKEGGVAADGERKSSRRSDRGVVKDTERLRGVAARFGELDVLNPERGVLESLERGTRIGSARKGSSETYETRKVPPLTGWLLRTRMVSDAARES